ncbi:hypothetical protein GCM10010211_34390 [Streptomyces albospinus]|uniref:Uncharacterized protein n=1 Tax=Streptomyces albospinus TaxID=285515 RepID=A0ABQ2V5S6_9ACTN|nr:hypothetical protein GCM10010211_34390 [Streptomyces albospinus]
MRDLLFLDGEEGRGCGRGRVAEGVLADGGRGEDVLDEHRGPNSFAVAAGRRRVGLRLYVTRPTEAGVVNLGRVT